MEAENSGETIMWDRTMVADVPIIEIARDGAKQALVDTIVKVQKAKEIKISLTSEEKESIRTNAEQYSEILAELGITIDEYAKMNEDVEIINKLSSELYKTIDHTGHSHGLIDLEACVKGEETTKPIATFNSRHILFSTKDLDEEATEQVRIKAEDVLKRVLNGEDFATLAGQFSEDPGSKNNGGLYENIEKGNFVSEYQEAALSLNPGEVYPQLVKSAHGYHIIKLEGITNPDGYNSTALAQNILLMEFSEESEKWVSEADIKINEQRYNSAQ